MQVNTCCFDNADSSSSPKFCTLSNVIFILFFFFDLFRNSRQNCIAQMTIVCPLSHFKTLNSSGTNDEQTNSNEI